MLGCWPRIRRNTNICLGLACDFLVPCSALRGNAPLLHRFLPRYFSVGAEFDLPEGPQGPCQSRSIRVTWKYQEKCGSAAHYDQKRFRRNRQDWLWYRKDRRTSHHSRSYRDSYCQVDYQTRQLLSASLSSTYAEKQFPYPPFFRYHHFCLDNRLSWCHSQVSSTRTDLWLSTPLRGP